jgi:PAS domain S-box-containing protein
LKNGAFRRQSSALPLSVAQSIDFRALFESAPDAYLVLDPELRIVAATDAYLAATNTARDAVVGRNLFEVVPGSRELRTSLETVLREARPHTTMIRTHDRDWSAVNLPVVAGGKVTHVIHRLGDITDVRALESLNDQMRAADRAKDEFIAVISHELRTPMTSILGWTRMLALGELDEQTHRDALDALERSTRAQAKLIEDLLDESRIAAGKLRLELRAADLAGLVEQAVRMARPSAEAKGIALSLETPPERCNTFADPMRLQQVIGNVLGNAIKFTPEGGSVAVRVARRDAFAVIEVADSGRGIEPDLLPFVFDAYRQGSANGERRGGLGLGLAITRHLVEMHGGSIDAKSNGAGRGATFTIRLPLHEEDASFVGRDPFARVAALPRLGGVRVLMVEDELDNRNVLATALKRCGAVVQCCTTAEAADQLIDAWSPHVLVCDIALPDRDGCAFLHDVRSRGDAVPALALTVLGRPQEQARILAAGFNVFRQKPIDPVDLAHDVARLARGGEAVAPAL